MLKSLCCARTVALLILPTLITSVLIVPMQAQNQRGPSSPPQVYTMPAGMPGTGFPSSSSSVSPEVERRMQNQMNQSREVELKRDTDQLMEMATELKQQVDKTGPAILSMDVIKKAEKIEKLAKSVREKMKGY